MISFLRLSLNDTSEIKLDAARRTVCAALLESIRDVKHDGPSRPDHGVVLRTCVQARNGAQSLHAIVRNERVNGFSVGK